ncbi:Permeases of the major facilitator superfamily [Nitrincola lacisaponensis]|uniref:Permeases of the major facilitator superfamily n=1 Tax=Nitrincola lacisaponensis TaxID=267850 RepID=A0A063Y1H7_9GAMM|nr:Permeases of the major facilitator superfamily [Nitrincola lacisaponensis]
MDLKVNVGGIDKIARILVGAILLILAIMGTGTPWTWIGILPLITGLAGRCPAYSLLGINTCGIKK